MIALDYGKSDNRWIKGIMVTLPIIGISFTTAISQFQIREIWGLRASGIAELEVQRMMLLIKGCDKDTLDTAMTQLSEIKKSQNLLGGVSTPERNCIGGRRKNTSRAEVEVWPSQVCGSQTQLSSSIGEPAFPSRPGIVRARRAAIRHERAGVCRAVIAGMAQGGHHY